MNETTTTKMTAEQMKKIMLDGLRARGWDRAYAFVEKQKTQLTLSVHMPITLATLVIKKLS